MYTRVVVPLDGSKAAEQVLPYARLLAEVLSIPVELLTAIDVVRLAETMGAPNKNLLNLIVDDATREKAQYLEEIGRSLGLATASCVEQGKPEEVIIERAASGKGTLVAMATHGRSGISRWFLGSIAEKVLRTIASAMLLVSCREEARYEPPGPLRFMLVPLDGSALAENVLPTAVELAKNLNLEILLARAYELPLGPYPGTDAFYVPQCNDLRAFVQEEARAYLEGKVNQVKSQGIEKASSAMLEGPAAEKIIELARATPDCLIAISTHGRSGIQRWVLGSVTEKVVRHCGRPVLVFPARAHESLAKPGTWWD